jgi:cytochrome c-type biogenesis protein
MLLAATNNAPLALAFGAGLVATVNPCGFAMLPSLVGYYVGSSGSGRGGGRVADGLLVGLVLTAGFMLLFGVVGTAFALGSCPG